MPWTSGVQTVGSSGADYVSNTAAEADMGVLTDDAIVNLITDISQGSGGGQVLWNVALSGFNLTFSADVPSLGITSAGRKISMDGNATAYTLASTDGNYIMDGMYLVGNFARSSSRKYVLPSSTSVDVTIKNSLFNNQSNGGRGVDIRSVNSRIYNNMFWGFPTSSFSNGIIIDINGDLGTTSANIENNVFFDCVNCIFLGNPFSCFAQNNIAVNCVTPLNGDASLAVGKNNLDTSTGSLSFDDANWGAGGTDNTTGLTDTDIVESIIDTDIDFLNPKGVATTGGLTVVNSTKGINTITWASDPPRGPFAIEEAGATGTGSLSLSAITLSAVGTVIKTGTGTLTLPIISLSATGTVTTIISGTGLLSLSAITLSAVGTVTSMITATDNLILSNISLSAVGVAITTITGTGSVTLPGLSLSAAGLAATTLVIGTGAITLPSLDIDASIQTVSICLFDDHSQNEFFHFQQNNSYDKERCLYDSLLSEGNNIYGTPMMYYVVSYDVSYDLLFGEDDDRRIERKFPIKAVFTLPEELEQYNPFGIQGLDNFPMNVSKKHFTQLSRNNNRSRLFPVQNSSNLSAFGPIDPKAGDLIKSEYNDVFYEIIDVGEEKEMFLQAKHSWTLTVRVFTDEMLSLSADTSAAMTEISAVIDRNDVLSHNDYITSADDAVLYDPPSTEKDSSQSAFGGW
jgi:hypothetical protein